MHRGFSTSRTNACQSYYPVELLDPARVKDITVACLPVISRARKLIHVSRIVVPNLVLNDRANTGCFRRIFVTDESSQREDSILLYRANWFQPTVPRLGNFIFRRGFKDFAEIGSVDYQFQLYLVSVTHNQYRDLSFVKSLRYQTFVIVDSFGGDF